jgi:hypothetical protein
MRARAAGEKVKVSPASTEALRARPSFEKAFERRGEEICRMSGAPPL